jgi:hypothetical protein
VPIITLAPRRSPCSQQGLPSILSPPRVLLILILILIFILILILSLVVVTRSSSILRLVLLHVAHFSHRRNRHSANFVLLRLADLVLPVLLQEQLDERSLYIRLVVRRL